MQHILIFYIQILRQNKPEKEKNGEKSGNTTIQEYWLKKQLHLNIMLNYTGLML